MLHKKIEIICAKVAQCLREILLLAKIGALRSCLYLQSGNVVADRYVLLTGM